MITRYSSIEELFTEEHFDNVIRPITKALFPFLEDDEDLCIAACLIEDLIQGFAGFTFDELNKLLKENYNPEEGLNIYETHTYRDRHRIAPIVYIRSINEERED